MKSIYTERAEKKAREETDARLAASLANYADDAEAGGLTYAPAYMREAARRLSLRVDQPAPTETECQCGEPGCDSYDGTWPKPKAEPAPQGAPLYRKEGDFLVEREPQGAPDVCSCGHRQWAHNG